MHTIKFATIGTSTITDKFLEAAHTCPEFEHYAVYSRNKETARAYADKHHTPVTYTSLDALAQDKNIDAVYIASPNALHCEQTLHMLNAGKHVLCEKALCSNLKEAIKVIDTARSKHLILLEAMRSLTDPGMTWIKDNLHKLGEVHHATFSFCQYSSRYDNFKAGNPSNIFSHEMSSGSLMDIGIYCIEPMIYLFGKPNQIFTTSVRIRTDIDGAGCVLASYDAMNAELIHSKICASSSPSVIQGEKGTMYIDAIYCPHDITINYNNGTSETHHVDGSDNNMMYETQTIIDAIHGKVDITPYQEVSLASMALLDEARKQIHLEFPADLK